jgi:hypothetical protein
MAMHRVGPVRMHAHHVVNGSMRGARSIQCFLKIGVRISVTDHRYPCCHVVFPEMLLERLIHNKSMLMMIHFANNVIVCQQAFLLDKDGYIFPSLG